jgi:16S rRNA (uracil1498-N3)-methyltransferase
VREATEQSGRGRTPIITEPLTLPQALSDQQASFKILLDEIGGQPTLPQTHPTTPRALFIGPEGGFTDNERQLFTEYGAHRLTLGSLVFRAETAAIVGLSMLRFRA